MVYKSKMSICLYTIKWLYFSLRNACATEWKNTPSLALRLTSFSWSIYLIEYMGFDVLQENDARLRSRKAASGCTSRCGECIQLLRLRWYCFTSFSIQVIKSITGQTRNIFNLISGVKKIKKKLQVQLSKSKRGEHPGYACSITFVVLY